MLDSESAVNRALSDIVTGPVGFDTEFTNPPTVAGEARLVLEQTDPWYFKRLCVVQVAIPDKVFIIAVKIMKGERYLTTFTPSYIHTNDTNEAFPSELRRILESEAIPKVGVGFPIDDKVLYEAAGEGLVIRNLVDIGLMTKFCDPQAYPSQDQTPLGLARCVQDVLGMEMDKLGQKTLRWDGELTEDHKLCK